jgi:UDP-N-acetylglucosamine 4-epimerase
MVEGDIRDPAAVRDAVHGAELVLHQAALGSVPRSLADPLTTNAVNVHGFLTVAWATREAGITRMVYASSSSVYGDHPALPKVESEVGTPLSPYAVSKKTDELYARSFSDHYGMEVVGLRYFNVFGPRQDPEGPYAAVIPKWFDALVSGERCTINGDGETSRDFCYVANVVQANLRAATASHASGVYNVGVGGRTTLNTLYRSIRDLVAERQPSVAGLEPNYADFRAGDIRHSHADISRARTDLGYTPTHDVSAGLIDAADWYLRPARATL